MAVLSQGQSLAEVRTAFHMAVLEPKQSAAFHAYVKDLEDPTPIMEAYQAVSEAMLAQVLWNPFSKLSQVIRYDRKMEEVVKADPDNIEIRFLRLAIEYNLPAILGMSTHIDEDVEMIEGNLSSIASMQLDPKFGSYIVWFLRETMLCNEEALTAMEREIQGG